MRAWRRLPGMPDLIDLFDLVSHALMLAAILGALWIGTRIVHAMERPAPDPTPTIEDLVAAIRAAEAAETPDQPEPKPLPAVLVTCTDGEVIRGVLVENRAGAIRLQGAALAVLDEGAQAPRWQSLDGELVIPTVKMSYYQVVDLATFG